MGDNSNYNSFNGPKNVKLAFFAYGILKPGQIAYSNIKKCIAKKNETSINYGMKDRDGARILLDDENSGTTWGYIYHFKDKEEAYKRINRTISNKLYKWGVIKIGTDDVNVLFGKNPNLGSVDIKDPEDKVKYDGKNDPLFKKVQSIRKDLESEYDNEEEKFDKLQRDYVILWSAIDRYCKLKYNKGKEHQNREELSKEQIFINSLQNLNKNNYRTIYTTELSERKFDTNEPKYILNYYYTIRCNIVHRGKTDTTRDIRLVKQATKDLLDIFENILKETFDDEN